MFGLFERGTIEITPEQFNYHPGDTIKGKVHIKLNKPIQANKLSIWLLGVETETLPQNRNFGFNNQNNMNGMNNSERRTMPIFQFELPIDGSKEYTEAEYPFEILIPASVLQSQQNAVPATGVLGVLASMAEASAGMAMRQITWSLEAILDIPGAIDMRKRIQVNIG